MHTNEDYDRASSPDAFDRYLDALRGRVGDAKYKSWFLDLGLAERTNECVTLSTGSQAKRDMLDNRFLPILTETWRETVGPVQKIRLTVKERLRRHAAKIDAQEERRARNGADNLFINKSARDDSKGVDFSEISAKLDPRRTFETFAVGDSNRIAWAAAQQALSKTGSRELIYFYGESGVGKTHLQHAICREWRAPVGGAGPNRR